MANKIIKKITMFPLELFFKYIFAPIYKNKLANYISPLIPKSSKVLDFGCGDGMISEILKNNRPDVYIEGVDIYKNKKIRIPFKKFDGHNLPYPDKYFDVVFVSDVLHHTQDIPIVLKEISRVSQKYVIIKDHITYGPFSNLLISFTDFISNFPFDVNCAFNFPTLQRWQSYFILNNLLLKKDLKPLKFGFGIDDKYNAIFLLEKINK